MNVAYVLISCEVGNEQFLIDELKTMPNVKEVAGVMGTYDILAKLEATSEKEIKDVVVSKIRYLPKVRTTITLTTREH